MSALLVDLSGNPAARERAAAGLEGPVEIVDLPMLQAWGPARSLARLRARTYDDAIVLVGALGLPRRWPVMVLVALCARARRRRIVDAAGESRTPAWSDLLVHDIPFAVRRARALRRALRDADAAARMLPAASASEPVRPGRVAMVRPDLGGPLVAGGSLAHVRGVAAGLRRAGCEVRLYSPAPVAGFELDGTDGEIIPDRPEFRTSVELPYLRYNGTFLDGALPRLAAFAPDLVYARHALGFYGAAEAARRLKLPLVVEYNGPEAWIARNWGAARSGLETFERVERAVLRAARCVVAVSEPLREPLERAGVEPARILVNPNGVDLETFDPEALAPRREAIRRRIGAGPHDVVVGFVGTFGPWHGAEVAARAAAAIPEPAGDRLLWLFVGDGPGRAATERAMREAPGRPRCHFTGLVPQDGTPSWIAAFDLALAPHVPNPDGSPFFGSPTKLFEYLASGKAVVASRLGQIGEVITDGVDGRLVPPADAGALAAAIMALASSPESRDRMGRGALATARARHGWDAHVRRILDALEGGG